MFPVLKFGNNFPNYVWNLSQNAGILKLKTK